MSSKEPTNVIIFATPAEFRAWLAANHATAYELWAGYYKKSSGRPSMSWPEAVDQALCYGRIDGIRKSLDDISYANRFTPRRKGSHWSCLLYTSVPVAIEVGPVSRGAPP